MGEQMAVSAKVRSEAVCNIVLDWKKVVDTLACLASVTRLDM